MKNVTPAGNSQNHSDIFLPFKIDKDTMSWFTIDEIVSKMGTWQLFVDAYPSKYKYFFKKDILIDLKASVVYSNNTYPFSYSYLIK